MKHRSPLVTLAAVAVAFIIMFTVNMLVSPPGGSSAEPARPISSASTASQQPPAQQTTSAVATPSASASESERGPRVPEQGRLCRSYRRQIRRDRRGCAR